jgi:hypothetical protein
MTEKSLRKHLEQKEKAENSTRKKIKAAYGGAKRNKKGRAKTDRVPPAPNSEQIHKKTQILKKKKREVKHTTHPLIYIIIYSHIYVNMTGSKIRRRGKRGPHTNIEKARST